MTKPIRLSLAALLLAACAGDGADDDAPFAADAYDWSEGYHVEDLEEVDCPTAQCLSIQEGSTYCSFDPGNLEDNPNGFFATKSMITLPAGTYPLHTPPFGTTIADFPVQVTTLAGSTTIVPANPLGLYYRIEPIVRETDGRVSHWETFHTVGGGIPDAKFVGEDIDVDDFGLVVPTLDFWQDRHFRTGDPTDEWWWFNVPRNLILGVNGPSAIFPKIADYESIEYAPCGYEGGPEDLFAFESEDGTVELTVRSVLFSDWFHHYSPRLISASGEFAGTPIEVSSFYDLAASSVTDSGSLTLPMLAVRTAVTDEKCGFFFSPMYASLHGSTPWKAFYMTCDDLRGDEIPLVSVTTPPGWEGW